MSYRIIHARKLLGKQLSKVSPCRILAFYKWIEDIQLIAWHETVFK